jgi:hypothetical protein
MAKVCDCGGWRPKLVTCDKCGRKCCADCYDFHAARKPGERKVCLVCMPEVEPAPPIVKPTH